MGGLLFGYDWVVIGGAKPFYEVYFHITSYASLQGLAMGSALIGCIAGSLLSGTLSDRYGRKYPLIFSGMLFLIGAVGTCFSGTFTSFIIFRAIGGVGIGLASNLSPVYIAEVAPAEIRGKLVSINQLAIVLGILLAQVINWQVAKPVPYGYSELEILSSWNGQSGWRWMFLITGLFALVFIFLMFFVPESPRWLLKSGEIVKAKNIFERISRNSMGHLQKEDSFRTEIISDNYFSKLFRPGVKRIIILGVVLAVFQQWCGINIIFNYAEDIFKKAGYGINDLLFNIVLTGSVNLAFTLIAMYAVDKFGRKPLMLAGAASLALEYIIIGILYSISYRGIFLLAMVVISIGTYALTLAPLTWVILSEIFPNQIRGVAMSVATLSLWIACLILTYSFPVLTSRFSLSGTFWIYSGVCIAGFIFILFELPETKGKTLEEIENQLLESKIQRTRNLGSN